MIFSGLVVLGSIEEWFYVVGEWLDCLGVFVRYCLYEEKGYEYFKFSWIRGGRGCGLGIVYGKGI